MLDIRTLIFMLFVSLAVTAVITLRLSRSTRLPGVKEWGIGAGCVASGVLLLGLRGAIHDIFSIVLANELILLGYAVVWDGMRRFIGREFSLLVTMLSVVVVGGGFVGFYYFAFVNPSTLVRTVMASMAILFFSTTISLTLSAGKYGRNWVTFTGALYGTNCLACALRVIHPILANDTVTLFNGGPVSAFFFLFSILFSIGVLVGQIFMVQEEMGDTENAPPISQLLFSTSR